MNNKYSSLSYLTRKKVFELARLVASDEVFNRKGQSIRMTEGLRSREDQVKYVREGKSFTMESYHLLGLAGDFVVAKKWYTKVIEVFWRDSYSWKRFGELAVEAGFRSYGVTHKWDHGHVEAPQIWQRNAPHCFAFVVLNLLQKISPKWRTYSKDRCYFVANSIADSVSMNKMVPSVKSALQLAKKSGIIKDFKKVKLTPDDFLRSKQRHLIISQKRKVMGSNRSVRWKKHADNIADGKGIYNHTSLVGTATPDGIWMINSHKKYPEYLIKWEHYDKSVQAVYEVFI